MEDFKAIDPPTPYLSVEAYMHSFRVGYVEAEKMRNQMMRERFFSNDTYLVNVSKVYCQLGEVIHLSIKRHDNEPVRSWSDLQEIKNLLVGPEHEAIEIYPAESRLVDMAPQYHLWVFADVEYRVPVGWTTRMVSSEVRV